MNNKIPHFEVVIDSRRNNKFGAKKTEYNGHVYDSKHEAQVAMDLDLLMKEKDPADRIVKVTPHPPSYPLVVNGVKISSYTADFKVEYESGKVEIIDAKSGPTKKVEGYRLRKKLMKALYDIDIIER